LNLQGMRVYLGGPLDVPGGELDVYAEATHQLTAWGAKVLSPHDFGLAEDDPVHPETAAALRAAIEADAAALHNADLVVVLPGGDPVAEAMAATFGLPVVSLVPARPLPVAGARIPGQRTAPDSLPSEVASAARR
jgi:hypothetical protein